MRGVLNSKNEKCGEGIGERKGRPGRKSKEIKDTEKSKMLLETN